MTKRQRDEFDDPLELKSKAYLIKRIHAADNVIAAQAYAKSCLALTEKESREALRRVQRLSLEERQKLHDYQDTAIRLTAENHRLKQEIIKLEMQWTDQTSRN